MADDSRTFRPSVTRTGLPFLKKGKLGKMYTARDPEAERLRHERIQTLLGNPDGTTSNERTTPSGASPKEARRNTPNVTIRGSRVTIDPLLHLYLSNAEDIQDRLELLRSKMRAQGLSDSDIDAIRYQLPGSDDLKKSVGGDFYGFLQRTLLIEAVAQNIEKLMAQGVPTLYPEWMKETPWRSSPNLIDSAADTNSVPKIRRAGAATYPLSWARGLTTEHLAKLFAYLEPLGYKFRSRKIDRYTSMFTYSPSKKAPIKGLPKIILVGARDKSIIYDLFIGDERVILFTYGNRYNPGYEEEGIPPSMMDENMKGMLSSYDASRYKDNLKECLAVIKSSMSEKLRNIKTSRFASIKTVDALTDGIRRPGNLVYRKLKASDFASADNVDVADPSQIPLIVRYFKDSLIKFLLWADFAEGFMEENFRAACTNVVRIFNQEKIVDKEAIRQLLRVELTEEMWETAQAPNVTLRGRKISKEKFLSKALQDHLNLFYDDMVTMCEGSFSTDLVDRSISALFTSIRDLPAEHF